MRIWFENTCNYHRSETNVHIGIASYHHKRKEWKGFTVHFFFLDSGFTFNYVDNYAEYTRIMQQRGFRTRRKSNEEAK